MALLEVQLLAGSRFICTPEWGKSPRHYADCHRLYFPIRGKAAVLYDTETCPIVPGQVYLFPGYRWMGYACRRRLTLNYMHFRFADSTLDLQLGALPGACHWPVSQWRFWQPVFTHMTELFNTRPAKLVLQAQAMVLWMMGELQERAHPRNNPLIASLEPLRPALAFMEQHFAKNPSLEEIAAQVHLSPQHFHRRFTVVFHLTPHVYLNRRRMHLAWSLLRHEGLSVTEVAARLHYGSPFYFSRAFKNFFGCPPLDIRLGRTGTGETP
jgi:AraC-like DNA-binding protein